LLYEYKSTKTDAEGVASGGVCGEVLALLALLVQEYKN
jgi:hypothetical protein